MAEEKKDLNPKLAEFRPRRETFTSKVTDMFAREEQHSQHVKEKRRKTVDNSLILSQSAGFEWLLGVIGRAETLAAKAESASFARGNTHEAAFNAGARENSRGLLSLLTKHFQETEE